MSSSEHTLSIERSASLPEACDRFLEDLGNWAHACIDRYGIAPPTDVHDQLTYTTGWEPYLLSSHDEQVMDFLGASQDAVAAHFMATDQWRHGYWRMQEAHHGTEHYELFLGFMTRIAPEHKATRIQLVDAVEHIGNWNQEVDDWYDPNTGLFRSLHFGADGVQEDELQLNMPDHLRCANLLLLAFNATGEKKYLELAESYAGVWADAITSDNTALPIGLTINGPIYELSADLESRYRAFAGMAGLLDTDLDRAENILTSSGPELFLQLWKHGGKDIFLDVTRRLLGVMVGELSDPDAGPVSDAIRAYRRNTGNHDFDDRVLETVDELAPQEIASIDIELPDPLEKRPAGIGKRNDMPVWMEDGESRRHNPILLSLAAEIRDDPELATIAADLATTYFRHAVNLMPDGRDHGCAARSVSAIARGHGRNNHAGMTTAVLLPVMQHFELVNRH